MGAEGKKGGPRNTTTFYWIASGKKVDEFKNLQFAAWAHEKDGEQCLIYSSKMGASGLYFDRSCYHFHDTLCESLPSPHVFPTVADIAETDETRNDNGKEDEYEDTDNDSNELDSSEENVQETNFLTEHESESKVSSLEVGKEKQALEVTAVDDIQPTQGINAVSTSAAISFIVPKCLLKIAYIFLVSITFPNLL